MNWVTVLTCLVLLTTTLVRAENNEIDETRPIRIDPILRKALLKALSTLEKESEEEKLAGVTSATTPSITSDSTKSNDELLEESTGADPATVQFHSFVAQPEKAGTTSDEIIKTVVVSAPHVTLMPPQFGKSNKTKNDDEIIIKFDHLDPIKNNDGIKIETIQLARSVSTSVNTNDADDTSKKSVESKSEPPKPRTTKTTTTTTTTTTTPAPVQNEDGENIEKVNKNDVQIYQAPLVSAFTIQQDEFGMPRNVIPLYKPVNTEPIFAQRNNFAPPQVPLLPPHQTQSQPQAQSSTVSQIVPSQQIFPGFFEQRQRELEQQVFLLQNQNRQQEALLNRQRYLDEQRQNQIILEQRLRAEEENRIRAQRLQQQQQIQQQQLRLLSPHQSNSVQFVPSISLNPVVQPSISVEQQLPIREPADFLAKSPQSSQFTNSIQPLKTLQPPLLPTVQELPVKPFQNFINPSTSSNIIPVPENLPQLPLATRNRVFRQESGTANFGRQNFQPSPQQSFQPQQPIFHQQQQQPQQQQQQNYNFNRQYANSQLQNLLFQSGITPGRSQEELNIIAKVLSLNHGIQQPPNNFIDEQRRFVRHASYYYF